MTFIRNAALACMGLLMQLYARPIYAQQNGKISLQAMIDSAQAHFPLLLQKSELVNSARAQKRDVQHSFLPSAIAADQLILGSDNSLPGSYLSLGVIPSSSGGMRKENTWEAASGNIAALNTQYELFDFGLKSARLHYAGAYEELSAADLERERYLMKWQIAKLYLDVLKGEYQLEIDRQNVSRYAEIYKVIEALTASGVRAGVDSSLALAEQAKTRIVYNQTEGQINQLRIQLSYLSGIPAEQIAIDSSGFSGLLLQLRLQGFPADTTVNPLLQYYIKRLSLSDMAGNLIRKSYLPKVLLNGLLWSRGSSIDYTGAYHSLPSGWGYQRFNYMAGLTLAYDLFSGIHKRDKLAVNMYNTRAEKYQVMQQEQSMQNMQKQSNEAIRTQLRNLQELPLQIRASQDAYDQKTAQYKAGLINLVDLTNASFVLYRSQTDYVQTLNSWILANLDKAAATGSLDQFIQTINK